MRASITLTHQNRKTSLHQSLHRDRRPTLRPPLPSTSHQPAVGQGWWGLEARVPGALDDGVDHAVRLVEGQEDVGLAAVVPVLDAELGQVHRDVVDVRLQEQEEEGARSGTIVRNEEFGV